MVMTRSAAKAAAMNDARSVVSVAKPQIAVQVVEKTMASSAKSTGRYQTRSAVRSAKEHAEQGRVAVETMMTAYTVTEHKVPTLAIQKNEQESCTPCVVMVEVDAVEAPHDECIASSTTQSGVIVQVQQQQETVVVAVEVEDVEPVPSVQEQVPERLAKIFRFAETVDVLTFDPIEKALPYHRHYDDGSVVTEIWELEATPIHSIAQGTKSTMETKQYDGRLYDDDEEFYDDDDEEEIFHEEEAADDNEGEYGVVDDEEVDDVFNDEEVDDVVDDEEVDDDDDYEEANTNENSVGWTLSSTFWLILSSVYRFILPSVSWLLVISPFVSAAQGTNSTHEIKQYVVSHDDDEDDIDDNDDEDVDEGDSKESNKKASCFGFILSSVYWLIRCSVYCLILLSANSICKVLLYTCSAWVHVGTWIVSCILRWILRKLENNNMTFIIRIWNFVQKSFPCSKNIVDTSDDIELGEIEYSTFDNVAQFMEEMKDSDEDDDCDDYDIEEVNKKAIGFGGFISLSVYVIGVYSLVLYSSYAWVRQYVS